MDQELCKFCDNLAEYSCNCLNITKFICKNHLVDHLNEQGVHEMSQNNYNISFPTKKKLISALMILKQNINKEKSKICLEIATIITNISLQLKNILSNLDILIATCDTYIIETLSINKIKSKSQYSDIENLLVCSDIENLLKSFSSPEFIVDKKMLNFIQINPSTFPNCIKQ